MHTFHGYSFGELHCEIQRTANLKDSCVLIHILFGKCELGTFTLKYEQHQISPAKHTLFLLLKRHVKNLTKPVPTTAVHLNPAIFQ